MKRGSVFIVFGMFAASVMPQAPATGATGEVLRWELVASEAEGPPARYSPCFAYDENRGYALLFGGGIVDDAEPRHLDDTWRWDGNSWSVVEAAPERPAACYGAGMTYDASREAVVMYEWSVNAQTAVWAWNGDSWDKIAAEDPPEGRTNSSVTYDQARASMLMYGGVAVTSPTVIDEQRVEDCFLGGAEFGIGFANETWSLAGAQWEILDPECRTPTFGRASPGLYYDYGLGAPVLFAGLVLDTVIPDMWQLDETGEWTRLLPRDGGALPRLHSGYGYAYDRTRERLVLTGGAYAAEQDYRPQVPPAHIDELWAFDGDAWAVLPAEGSPPHSLESAAMVYDVRRDVVVLFGTTSGPSSRTWELGPAGASTCGADRCGGCGCR